MRLIAYCWWLDWYVDIFCTYLPLVPFLRYYFRLYDLIEETTKIGKKTLYTNIEIKETSIGFVEVQCGCRRRNIVSNCNNVLGAVAEFCNDDFLEKKKEQWCLLHGAAVSFDGKTTDIFLAPTGIGKSTLAYYTCIHGASFCSDDLIIIDMEIGRLLPYPKPVYLRNTDFLCNGKVNKRAPWYQYRMLFAENEVKYPVFPRHCICAPIEPIGIHIYERGGLYQQTNMKKTEGFRELLINSMLITDTKCHNNQLVQLVQKYNIDRVCCNDLNDLLYNLNQPIGNWC